MSLPRYAEYRECGVQWLGSIPANWKPTPLKYLADFVNGYVFKPGTWSESGTPIIRIENLNGSNNFNFYDGELDERNHVAKGDLLFGWSGNRGTSFGPVIWKRAGHYFLNQHIFKIAGTRCDVGWLYWCLKAVTTHVEDQATGIIGMVHVTKGDLGAIKVPVPSAEEQTAIATFLDRETGKIDALIAEQEKLLTLLAEKRQATISHAVTRGLNPDAPMKDSGVAWLGEVPVHWNVVCLRRIARNVETGGTPSSESPSGDLEDGLPWYTPGDFGAELVLCDSQKRVALSLVDSGEVKAFPPGSILIVSIGATLGKVGLSGSLASANQQINAVLLNTSMDELFVAYSLSVKSEVMRFLSNASTIGIMNQSKTKEIQVAVPPQVEQVSVASYLDEATARVDLLEVEASRAITLLKERRSALIAAAVTGKIDVRQAV